MTQQEKDMQELGTTEAELERRRQNLARFIGHSPLQYQEAPPAATGRKQRSDKGTKRPEKSAPEQPSGALNQQQQARLNVLVEELTQANVLVEELTQAAVGLRDAKVRLEHAQGEFRDYVGRLRAGK